MGGGSWSPSSWATHATATASMSRSALYSSRGIKKELDPKGVAVRESRDSTEHPESTAIAVFLDVTGSMGFIAEKIAKEGLGTLFQEILDRKPVSDPQLLFGAIGDVRCDSAPLQVSQFESDNRIVEQLTGIYLESGGGGNDTESYDFPWYFAAKHMAADCFEKRGKKGYLFTVGDESTPAGITPEHLKEFLGSTEEITEELSAEELLAMAEKKWNCYHIIVEEGNYCSSRGRDAVLRKWQDLMGQRAVPLSDYTKLPEVIISLIQLSGGADKKKVVDSWDGSTSVAVAAALDGVSIVGASGGSGGSGRSGMVKL